jgi:predicted  nucleic acid-binding Zn-ribbon protein
MSLQKCENCGRDYPASDTPRESSLCPECSSSKEGRDDFDLTPPAVGEQDTDILPVVEAEINESRRRKAAGQEIREKVEDERGKPVEPEPDLPGLDPRLPLGLKPSTFLLLLFLALLLVVAAGYYLIMY